MTGTKTPAHRLKNPPSHNHLDSPQTWLRIALMALYRPLWTAPGTDGLQNPYVMVGPQYRPVGPPPPGGSPVGACLSAGPARWARACLPACCLPLSGVPASPLLPLSLSTLWCACLSLCLTGRALPCPCLSLSLSCLTSALPLPLLTQAAHCLPGRQRCPAHPGNSIVTVTNPSCRGERYQVAYQGDVSGPREPGPRSCLRCAGIPVTACPVFRRLTRAGYIVSSTCKHALTCIERPICGLGLSGTNPVCNGLNVRFKQTKGAGNGAGAPARYGQRRISTSPVAA